MCRPAAGAPAVVVGGSDGRCDVRCTAFGTTARDGGWWCHGEKWLEPDVPHNGWRVGRAAQRRGGSIDPCGLYEYGRSVGYRIARPLSGASGGWRRTVGTGSGCCPRPRGEPTLDAALHPALYDRGRRSDALSPMSGGAAVNALEGAGVSAYRWVWIAWPSAERNGRRWHRGGRPRHWCRAPTQARSAEVPTNREYKRPGATYCDHPFVENPAAQRRLVVWGSSAVRYHRRDPVHGTGSAGSSRRMPSGTAGAPIQARLRAPRPAVAPALRNLPGIHARRSGCMADGLARRERSGIAAGLMSRTQYLGCGGIDLRAPTGDGPAVFNSARERGRGGRSRSACSGNKCRESGPLPCRSSRPPRRGVSYP